MLLNWLAEWKRLERIRSSNRRSARSRRQHAVHAPLQAEVLEDRTMLTVYTVTTLDDAVDADGQLSLREAIEAANTETAVNEAAAGQTDGDRIIFDPSLAGTIVLSGELLIADDLEIDGAVGNAGRITIDGDDAGRIFQIDTLGFAGSEFRVLLTNLIVTNGAVSDLGAGILISSDEDVRLTNMDITDSTADVSGGGIFNASGSTLNISNSTISGNSATNGGGIANDYGNLDVTQSTISGNFASVGGGIGNYKGRVNITSSSIDLNSATYGGGIGNLGTLHVADSTVSRNVATYGGAIGNDGQLAVTNSILSGNIANNAGGGIANSYYGETNVTGSTLSLNSAANGGGIANSGTVNLTNSTLSGNFVAEAGGGIYNDSGTVNVSNSTLVENDAIYGGGIFNNSNSTANVVNSTLSGNDGNFRGGGIYNSGTVNVNNSTLANNTAGYDAGGIYNRYLANVRNSVITGNAAFVNPDVQGDFTSNGANVVGDVGNSTGFEGDITGTAPEEVINLALADNGGPTLTHALATDSPAIDAGNNDDARDADGNPLLTDQRGFAPRIVNGTVDIGAVELNALIDTSLIIVTVFEDENDGDLSLDDISLREAVILANANPNVTTIILAMGEYTLSIEDVDFDEDGALTGDLDITTEVIIQGAGADQTTINATGLGNRVLHVLDMGNLTVDGTTITGGTVTPVGFFALGGGLRIEYDGTASVTNSTISGNSADFGGGIFSYGTVNVSNSTIIENEATYGGGGIANVYGRVNVTNSTLSGNSASGFGGGGGGIYNFGGTVDVTNSTLSGNIASNGGGIFNRYGSVNVADSKFLQNSAINGGGIYNEGTLRVTNAVFSENEAAYGGGILNRSEASVTNSTLSGNTANGSGGGIANNGTLNLTNSTVSGNFAYDDGGGIYNDSTANVINSTISGNIANGGGGIFNYFGTLNVTNSTLSGNSAVFGGGIHNFVSPYFHGPATIRNTIITGNTASSANLDVQGTFISNYANVIGDDAGSDGFDMTQGDDIGTPPEQVIDLSLADNGGPTLTHALVPSLTNPAIDSGFDDDARDELGNQLTTDQRGLPRFVGTVDIGAVEYNGPIDTTQIIVTIFTDENDGDLSLNDISLREAVILANLDPNATTIILAAGEYALSLSGANEDAARTGDLDITTEVIIQGAGADTTTITATGLGDRVMHVLSTGNLTVDNVALSGASISGLGGGILGESGSTVSVINSRLSGNSAVAGGGIATFGAVTVTNTLISGNSVEGGGGGILNFGMVSVTNSTLSNNSANLAGGGISNVGGANVTITNSTLSGNSTAGGGGGIANLGTVSVINSTLSGNSAGSAGGGLYNGNGTFNVTNSTLSGNSAGGGGGAFNLGDGILTVTNSTLSVNFATVGGGILSSLNLGTTNVRNSIITGNTADVNPDVQGAFTSNSHNVIGNVGSSTGFGGTDNIGTPAAQVIDLTLADNGGPTMTHALVAGSPAIDAGLNGDAVDELGNPLTTDQRGFVPRIVNGIVDIGAYEDTTILQGIIYVNDNFTLPDGTMIADADPNTTGDQAAIIGINAFNTIQEGVDAATDGGTVFITDDFVDDTDDPVSGNEVTLNDGPGSYIENVTINKNVSVISTEGDPAAVIVDGNDAGSVFQIFTGNTVTLDSLTIQNGSATFGGGIRNSGTLFVNNSLVQNNTVSTDGGGIDNFEGTLTVSATTITHNSAGRFGGGIANVESSSLLLESSTVDNNSARSGGGIDNFRSTATIQGGSLITNNTATEDGGGINNSSATLTIQSGVQIRANIAATFSFGGGLFNDNNATATIQGGSLITENSAGQGGGLFNASDSSLTIDGSIISANTATSFGGGGIFNAGTAVIQNSTLITGNSTAVGAGIRNAGNLTVQGGSMITENLASFGGGGIYNEATATIQGGSLIADNTATGKGGGIYNASGSTTGTVLMVLESTIEGNSANDGGGIYNEVQFLGLSSVTATIDNSTITDNTAANGAGIYNTSGSASELAVVTVQNNSQITMNTATSDGGGIWNAGSLILDNIALGGTSAGNSASNNGGGLYNKGMANVTNSTISGNTGKFHGGGMHNASSGTLDVTNTTLSGNTATYGSGGGIINRSIGSTVNVTNSTLSGNRAGAGGGIANFLYSTVNVTNSTLSGNSATEDGGGIYNRYGTVNVTNSTLARNTADSYGGGFYNEAEATATIRNSIITGNMALSGRDVKGVSRFTSNGANVIGDDTGSTGFGGTDNIGTEPEDVIDLTLAGNGGPTLTHALVESRTNPAINAGLNADAVDEIGNPLVTDQRGEPFARIVDDQVDIGAFELQTLIPNDIIVTAPGPGTEGIVEVADAATQNPLFSFEPFPNFGGGVRVAVGDVNGDNTPDIITGAGPGGGPHVKVIDGSDGTTELYSFFAFETVFSGGVFVASADLTGDDKAEIIVGADAGGGPRVVVFDGADGSQLFSFFAYSTGFAGGVRVAAGDISGDGTPDIITGAGPGGGPHVKVFDGTDITELASFFAYDPGFSGGVFVAAGKVNDDGRVDLITGAGEGGGPHVKVFDGGTLMQLTDPIGSFFAYETTFTGGVRVAATDLNGDGQADILTAPGPNRVPAVRAFDAASTGSPPTQIGENLVQDPAFTGGIYVAASTDLKSTLPPLALDNDSLDQLFTDSELLEELFH